MGDGQTHTAFKRANVSKEVGQKAIEDLVEIGIIKVAKPDASFRDYKQSESVSNRLYFTSPFLRFWFAFVSPLFKGVRDGDFKEVKERFLNREREFYLLSFVELSHELLKTTLTEDPILEIASYWDKEVEFDILAKTSSGKVIVGSCKYTNSKVKKSELTQLQEKAKTAGITPDICVIVAKQGFSNELKSLKGADLKLLALKNFKSLLA